MRETGWRPSGPKSSRRWREFVTDGLEHLGGQLLIPPSTFAHVLIATSDSVVLGSELDDIDLYRPIVEMYMPAIKLP